MDDNNIETPDFTPPAKPLKQRLGEVKAGTDREETYRDLCLHLGNSMGLFIEWFMMNGLSIPGVISADLEKESKAANDALEVLESGAVIFQPKFNA